MGVSIPIGFSSSLQLPKLDDLTAPDDKFQSLSGFQVRCNPRTLGEIGDFSRVFQSLSGFQVRCNVIWLSVLIRVAVFQSLSGFQVRCNKKEGGELERRIGFPMENQKKSNARG